MKFDWHRKPKTEIQRLRGLCPTGEYRRIEAGSLPTGILPQALVDKCHDAFIMCSGTDHGRAYLMINLNRLDGDEIDQMPYCIAYEDDGPLASGVLVQHGSYDSDRTIPLPPDFDDYVQASGLYPLSTMPADASGSIQDLNIPSQEAAFQTVVDKVRGVFPEDSGDSENSAT